MQVATENMKYCPWTIRIHCILQSVLWNYALKMFTSCVEAIGQPAQGNGLSNGDHNENDCNNLNNIKNY
jgi:hypothetical protein